MKQKEYDQWNDPQEFYSDDCFLSKKGMAILHEYLVKCYHTLNGDVRWQRKKTVIIHSLRCFLIDVKFSLFRFYPLTWRET